VSSLYVVATDLSVASRKGAAVAAALASKTGACVDLICAIPRDRLDEEDAEGRRHLLAEVREQIAGLATECAPRGDPATTHVAVVNDVAKSIVRHAERSEAEMLVVAPQGATAWKKLVLGSTAAKVLRLAPKMLLLARPAKPMPPKDVLVAVDRSAGAVRALRHAMELGVQLDARLHVLWVPRPPGALVHLREALDSSEDYKRAKAREMKLAPEFAAWVAELTPPGLTVTTRVEEGNAVSTILTQARLTKSSLIVMGMHGKSRAQELLVGSVAHAVGTAAPVSVLLVRARPPRRRKAK
jgi:nucleotide-binding universal stress UspA family protein